MNWSALKVVRNPNKSACVACRIPIDSDATAYGLPDVRGEFCSMDCLECQIFGEGRCSWCGAATDTKYCGDACRKANGDARARGVRLGDGTRLLGYLERHHAALYAVVRQGAAGCLFCGGPLVGKRSDAKTCSDRCRVALKRRGEGIAKAEAAPKILSDFA